MRGPYGAIMGRPKLFGIMGPHSDCDVGWCGINLPFYILFPWTIALRVAYDIPTAVLPGLTALSQRNFPDPTTVHNELLTAHCLSL